MPAAAAPPIPGLEDLRHSPVLPEALQYLQNLWDEEQRARQKFYEEITDDVKAEFIDGEIIVHSPARLKHSETRWHIESQIRALVAANSLGGQVISEKACCHFPRNSYEPDVVYFGPDKAAKLTDGTVIFPIPDLAVEILSESTARIDRGVKFQDYETHGVQEYWIADADADVVEQYVRGSGGRYELRVKSGSGELVSPVLGDATIDIKRLFGKA
jgi:Uma2 family endonuclease